MPTDINMIMMSDDKENIVGFRNRKIQIIRSLKKIKEDIADHSNDKTIYPYYFPVSLLHKLNQVSLNSLKATILCAR